MLESSIDIPYFLIFIAILAFQIIYIFFQWIFIRKTEYLWYIAYMFGMGIYAAMIYNYIPDIRISDGVHLNFRNTFDKALPILSFYFYFRFARAFIGMKETFQLLNTWIVRLELLLLAYIAIDLTWKLIGQDQPAAEFVFRLIAIILFSSSWILIIAFLRKKLRLSYFLVFGAIIINVGNFLAMWMIVRQSMNLFVPFDPFLINSSAIIIDLLAFTTGLSYKVRLSEIEKANLNRAYTNELVLKLELQHEMIEIRHHIAKEIHEELGEGISDISIYAGIAQKEITADNLQVKSILDKIRTRSIEVLATLQDLIWTLSPDNTSYKSLLAKIQQMQREELSPNNIPLKLNYSENIVELNLKLPILKTAISTCRKVFYLSTTINTNHIDLLLSESALELVVHFSQDDLNVNTRTHFERLADKRLVKMTEQSNSIIFTLPITSNRY